MLLTTETIRSWVDRTKAGIIVVGNPRCGSHYLADIIYQSITDLVDAEYIDEIQNTDADDITTPTWFMRRMVIAGKYTVSTAVIQDVKWSMFNLMNNYNDLRQNFTIVKLTRDLVDQYMSHLIKQQMKSVHANDMFHSGMTPDQFKHLISYPVTTPLPSILRFLREHQLLLSLPCDYEVKYSDLSLFTGQTNYHVKNDYGVGPTEFFEDFNTIKRLFDRVVFHGI